MPRSETTNPVGVPKLHGAVRPFPTPRRRRTNWVSRHVPVPLVYFGIVATAGWAGVLAWEFVRLIRWMVV